MNIYWKIFNIVNLICLTLVAYFLALPFLAGRYHLNNSKDFFLYAIVILMILAVVFNCLHNIYLTRLCTNRARMSLTRKIWFWTLLALFAAVMWLFIYYTCEAIFFRLKFTGAYKPTSSIKYFKQMSSISITGLYIIIAQIILFFRIKQSYMKEVKDTISEIGS